MNRIARLAAAPKPGCRAAFSDVRGANGRPAKRRKKEFVRSRNSPRAFNASSRWIRRQSTPGEGSGREVRLHRKAGQAAAGSRGGGGGLDARVAGPRARDGIKGRRGSVASDFWSLRSRAHSPRPTRGPPVLPLVPLPGLSPLSLLARLRDRSLGGCLAPFPLPSAPPPPGPPAASSRRASARATAMPAYEANIHPNGIPNTKTGAWRARAPLLPSSAPAPSRVGRVAGVGADNPRRAPRRSRGHASPGRPASSREPRAEPRVGLRSPRERFW